MIWIRTTRKDGQSVLTQLADVELFKPSLTPGKSLLRWRDGGEKELPFTLDEVIQKITEAAPPGLRDGDLALGISPFIVVDLRGEVAK